MKTARSVRPFGLVQPLPARAGRHPSCGWEGTNGRGTTL